ncbi:MAG: lipoprotein [Venatoribacter sp.]
MTKIKMLLAYALLLALTSLVVGCGQKGPLYFPEQDTPSSHLTVD